MIQIYGKNGITLMFWQIPKDADSIGEPAIAMKVYSDVLELRQGKHVLMIEKSCVPEFLKAIREVMSFEEKKP